jgi:hypothetical protein
VVGAPERDWSVTGRSGGRGHVELRGWNYAGEIPLVAGAGVMAWWASGTVPQRRPSEGPRLQTWSGPFLNRH